MLVATVLLVQPMTQMPVRCVQDPQAPGLLPIDEWPILPESTADQVPAGASPNRTELHSPPEIPSDTSFDPRTAPELVSDNSFDPRAASEIASEEVVDPRTAPVNTSKEVFNPRAAPVYTLEEVVDDLTAPETSSAKVADHHSAPKYTSEEVVAHLTAHECSIPRDPRTNSSAFRDSRTHVRPPGAT